MSPQRSVRASRTLENPKECPCPEAATVGAGGLAARSVSRCPFYYAGASLTLIGTVDYMTHVATIDHIPYPPPWSDEPTNAAFDDRLKVGGKVGLVFPLR